MANNTDASHSHAADDGAHTHASVGSVVEDDSADSDATVLAKSPALEADEFPPGLSPRELSLTLKGQLLDHFHLQEFIGGGGMGAVFKALDTTLDRIVAVKVVASQSVSSEDLQRRFLVEAQSTARLDHPNIARIHYVGRDRGLPYIVFEYIEGVNLRDLVVNHGTIPLGDALSFTYQIAHALAHAWQKEVVHRDIKPSNILISREGQAKLVDMGLARLSQVSTGENDLTNTGMTLGTFDYISPEQARDPREADTRSDIYSLGCTLFYMLAGRAPFAQGTAVQKLLQHQDQAPPDLAEIRPDVPAPVAQIVARMLEKSPDLRPRNPTELVRNLDVIFQDLGLQPPASLAPLPLFTPPVEANRVRDHLPWALPLAGLLLVATVWASAGKEPSAQSGFPALRSVAASPASEAATDLAEPPEQPDSNFTDQTLSDQQRPQDPVESTANSGARDSLDFGTFPLIATPSTGESVLEFPSSEPLIADPGDGTAELPAGLQLDTILLTE